MQLPSNQFEHCSSMMLKHDAQAMPRARDERNERTNVRTTHLDRTTYVDNRGTRVAGIHQHGSKPAGATRRQAVNHA